jgi:hypothetical protein
MKIDKNTIHYLFRYGYGGLLFLIICATFYPESTKDVLEALGVLTSPLAVLVIGAFIYTTYKATVAKPMWFVCAWFHLPLRKKFRMESTKIPMCKFYYLGEKFTIPRSEQEDAFRIVRNNMFPSEIRQQFNVQHSENHLLYLTFYIFSCAILYSLFSNTKKESILLFLLMALLSLAVGIRNDILICRSECFQLKVMNETEIKNKLEKLKGE